MGKSKTVVLRTFCGQLWETGDCRTLGSPGALGTDTWTGWRRRPEDWRKLLGTAKNVSLLGLALWCTPHLQAPAKTCFLPWTLTSACQSQGRDSP